MATFINTVHVLIDGALQSQHIGAHAHRFWHFGVNQKIGVRVAEIVHCERGVQQVFNNQRHAAMHLYQHLRVKFITCEAGNWVETRGS